MATNRVCYSLMLIASVAVYIYTNTYFTLILTGIVFVLPIISFILMMLSANALSVKMDVPYGAEKKEAAIDCYFKNAGILPIARATMTVHIENQMTGSSMQRQIVATVESQSETHTKFAIRDCKVGMLILSADKVRTYDVLGLFCKKKEGIQNKSILILPEIKDINLDMQQPVETGSDSERFSPYKSGNDVSEVFALREYVPGDEVRKINWKLSSKMDKTIVKEHSLALNYSIFLLLELKKNKEEIVDAMVEQYLSLSRTLLEEGINHTLAWFDSGEGVFHSRPMDNFEDFDIAVNDVLMAFASGSDTDALKYYYEGGYINPQSILLYVTASPDMDLIQEIEVQQEVMTYIVSDDDKVFEQFDGMIKMIPVKVADNN